MSDNKFPVKTVPFDAVTNVEISGAYLARLHQLNHFLISHIKPNDVARIKADMETGDPKDPLAYHMLTVMVLIRSAETQMEKEGKSEIKEVTPPQS
jgi:hypothetical protein